MYYMYVCMYLGLGLHKLRLQYDQFLYGKLTCHIAIGEHRDTHVCMFVCMYVCMYVCMFVFVCMFVYMYVCMHLHVCMYVLAGIRT